MPELRKEKINEMIMKVMNVIETKQLTIADNLTEM